MIAGFGIRISSRHDASHVNKSWLCFFNCWRPAVRSDKWLIEVATQFNKFSTPPEKRKRKRKVFSNQRFPTKCVCGAQNISIILCTNYTWASLVFGVDLFHILCRLLFTVCFVSLVQQLTSCAYLMHGCNSSLCVSCSVSASVRFIFCVSYFSVFVSCSLLATFQCLFHVLC